MTRDSASTPRLLVRQEVISQMPSPDLASHLKLELLLKKKNKPWAVFPDWISLASASSHSSWSQAEGVSLCQSRRAAGCQPGPTPGRGWYCFRRSLALPGSPGSRLGADPLSAGVSCGHRGLPTCPKVFTAISWLHSLIIVHYSSFRSTTGCFLRQRNAVKFSISGAFVWQSYSISFEDPCWNAACEFCQMACWSPSRLEALSRRHHFTAGCLRAERRFYCDQISVSENNLWTSQR